MLACEEFMQPDGGDKSRVGMTDGAFLLEVTLNSAPF